MSAPRPLRAPYHRPSRRLALAALVAGLALPAPLAAQGSRSKAAQDDPASRHLYATGGVHNNVGCVPPAKCVYTRKAGEPTDPLYPAWWSSHWDMYWVFQNYDKFPPPYSNPPEGLTPSDYQKSFGATYYDSTYRPRDRDGEGAMMEHYRSSACRSSRWRTTTPAPSSRSATRPTSCATTTARPARRSAASSRSRTIRRGGTSSSTCPITPRTARTSTARSRAIPTSSSRTRRGSSSATPSTKRRRPTAPTRGQALPASAVVLLLGLLHRRPERSAERPDRVAELHRLQHAEARPERDLGPSCADVPGEARMVLPVLDRLPGAAGATAGAAVAAARRGAGSGQHVRSAEGVVAGPAGAGQMSYLDAPRLHFAGDFQVDISTINNVVGYYKSDAFEPQYQELDATATDGGWNPEGTGIFRLIGCRITGARLGERSISAPGQDPVIGMALESAAGRVFGKLADLDPQQQMCSQIWGMRLRLTNGAETALFSGDYVPAAFQPVDAPAGQGEPPRPGDGRRLPVRPLRRRVGRANGLQGPRGAEARVPERAVRRHERLRLRARSDDPRYTMGRVTGTIGPSRAGEPKHFVTGRQMVAATPDGMPFKPTNGVLLPVQGAREGQDRRGGLRQLPRDENPEGELVDQGPLVMAVLKAESATIATTVTAAEVAILGEVNYRQAGWYERTAGVQDFGYGHDSWCAEHIAKRPLLLLSPRPGAVYAVIVAESPVFTVGRDRQVLRWFPNDALPIVDLKSACRGIDIIVDQGEGTSSDPFQVAGRPGPLLQVRRDPARPHDRQDRHRLRLRGRPHPVRPGHMHPMKPNPKIADFEPGSQAHTRVSEFAYAYSSLLNALHQAFNGAPDRIDAAIGLMYELRMIAVGLMQTPVGDGSPQDRQGRGFEYVDTAS